MKNNCPKCGKPIGKYAALSREDNKTEICSACGMLEAIAEWGKHKEVEYDIRRYKGGC